MLQSGAYATVMVNNCASKTGYGRDFSEIFCRQS